MEIGMKGSPLHVLTNKNMTMKGKAACYAEQTKEEVKDILKLGGVVAGTAATASIATGCSNTLTNMCHQAKSSVGNFLDQFVIQGQKYEPQLGVFKYHTLKSKIKCSSLYRKLNALPTPAKAALAAGAATLAIVGPLFAMGASSKQGYIEGKHEIKK